MAINLPWWGFTGACPRIGTYSNKTQNEIIRLLRFLAFEWYVIKFSYFRTHTDGLTILAAGMDMDEEDDERDGLRMVEDQDYDADFVCIKGTKGG